MDPNRQYLYGALPDNVWNAVGQTVNYNGQQVRVVNPGDGTRMLQPLSSADQAQQIVQQAQQAQIQANQPAIQTLQEQKSNLSSAYADLLKSVLGQGTVAQNYITSAQNTLLGQRGIVDNTSPLYQQTIGSALLPAQQQFAQEAAQIGQGSAQDINALAGNIASLQAGNIPGALNFAGNLLTLQQQGSLLPSQIAVQEAQAKQAGFVPIPGYGVYSLGGANGQLIGGLSGVPGQGVTNVNGVPSLYIP